MRILHGRGGLYAGCLAVIVFLCIIETVSSGGKIVAWGDNWSGQLTQPVSIDDAIDVAAAHMHTCALLASGAVRCFGYNYYGQTDVPPGLASGATPATAVASTYHHTCALLATGSVVCFGDNQYGQTNVPAGLPTATAVATGQRHTCALLASGSVFCFGDNQYGQTNVPAGLTSATAIAAGSYHTCVVLTTGEARCWGDNQHRQLNIPAGLKTATSVAANSYHTCVVLTTGEVRCFGDSFDGLGAPANYTATTARLATGELHVCALLASGALRCWGLNNRGQTNVPADIENGTTKATAVACGTYHTCVVVAPTGSLRCFGDTTHDQGSTPVDFGAPVQAVSARGSSACALLSTGALRCMGFNLFDKMSVPANLTAATAVTVGETFTCALLVSGTVSCWGGAPGSGATNVPSGLTTATRLAAGRSHVCALLSSGAIRCWGSGMAPVPADIASGAAKAVDVAAADTHTCAVMASGGVRCWGGDYYYGQTNVPAGLPPATAVATGAFHTCVLLSAGSVRCFGSNFDGQLDVPAGLTTAVALTAGQQHNCALLATHDVQCWGGTSFRGVTSVPAGLTSATAVAAGGYSTYALKPDNLPVAVDHSFSTIEDVALRIDAPGLLRGASDADGDVINSVVISPASGPSHGNVTIFANGSFVYTPAANYHGVDSFTYKARDVDGYHSLPATVTITVDSVDDVPSVASTIPPFIMKEDGKLQAAAPGLLRFASDGDGDPLTMETAPVAGPANGTLALRADGSFDYAPSVGFAGDDWFVFRVVDGRSGGTATGNATIRVENVAPTAPLALPEFKAYRTARLDVAAPGVLAGVAQGHGRLAANLSWAAPVTGGAVEIAPDGGFRFTPAATGSAARFEVLATDAYGANMTRTVTVKIVNRSPPLPAPTLSLFVLRPRGTGAAAAAPVLVDMAAEAGALHMLSGGELGAPGGIDIRLSLPPGSRAQARTACTARLPRVRAGPNEMLSVEGAGCAGCQRCLRSLRLNWGDAVLVAVRARACPLQLRGVRCAASDFSAPLNITV